MEQPLPAVARRADDLLKILCFLSMGAWDAQKRTQLCRYESTRRHERCAERGSGEPQCRIGPWLHFMASDSSRAISATASRRFAVTAIGGSR